MTSAEKSLLCRRDAARRIVALTREVLDPKVAKGEGWEPVRADDPEVRQFLEQGDDLPSQLALSDAGMGRVTEDLIDVLIDRGVIQFTDLPAAAQIRLMARYYATGGKTTATGTPTSSSNTGHSRRRKSHDD